MNKEIKEGATFAVSDGDIVRPRHARFDITRLIHTEAGFRISAEWRGGSWGHYKLKISSWDVPKKIRSLFDLGRYFMKHENAIYHPDHL